MKLAKQIHCFAHFIEKWGKHHFVIVIPSSQVICKNKLVCGALWSGVNHLVIIKKSVTLQHSLISILYSSVKVLVICIEFILLLVLLSFKIMTTNTFPILFLLVLSLVVVFIHFAFESNPNAQAGSQCLEFVVVSFLLSLFCHNEIHYWRNG